MASQIIQELESDHLFRYMYVPKNVPVIWLQTNSHIS